VPLKITVRNLDSGATHAFELPGPQVRIGRNGLNELTLDQGFISQFHGVIRLGPDGIVYTDLGSTNGSTLDGKRLAKNIDMPITGKSDLRIGPLRLDVEIVAARDPVPTPPGMRDRQPTGPHHTVAMFGMPRATDPGRSQSQPGRPSVTFGKDRPAGMPPDPNATPPPATGSSPAVKELARRLLPPGREPASEADANRLVTAVAVMLDAFAHSFVGLRRGVEQTGAELGVRTVPSRSPLYTAKDHRQVLSYLLDSGGKDQALAQELVSVFADFGVHQVALLNGITESVKALLGRLVGAGGGGRKGIWPFGGGDEKGTADSIRELLEDDRQLHAAIFGEEFAIAYAAGTLGTTSPGQPKPKGVT
jgi:predicted component of type VI protein secretion system